MKTLLFTLLAVVLSSIGNAQNSQEVDLKTSKEDSLFQKIYKLGKFYNSKISFYNSDNVQNQFDFNSKPLDVMQKNISIEATKLNWKSELELLEYFFRGGDSLQLLLKRTQDGISAFPNMSLDFYYNCVLSFSETLGKNNRLIVSTNPKYLFNLKEMGQVKYVTSKFSKLIISPGIYSKKLEKKLAKYLTKNKVLNIDKANYIDFLQNSLNVNKEYLRLFELRRELILLESYYSSFIKKLNVPNETYKNLTFIGYTNKGIPNGFGLLLNNNKQLISTGFWEESFPVLLYSVNTYFNSKKDEDYYKYIVGPSPDGKYKQRKIDFDFSQYKDKDIRTFNVYFGECNNNGREGYGCYFFQNYTKENLIYYQGQWNTDGKQEGKGTSFNNGYTYTGNWVAGNFITGSMTWPDKKTIYTGSFKDFKMHGMGKKVNADGVVQEGLFENGTFIKSLAQIEQEKIQREQEEEKRMALLLLEEKLRELKNEAEKQKRIDNAIVIEDINEVLDNPNYYFGKVILIVASCGNMHQREYSTVLPKGYVQNQMFKGTQYYQNDLKPTQGDPINWKRVTEVNSGISITINIPNRFFENNLIPEARGMMPYYTLLLDVYPMTESRSSSINGRYNSGGSARDVNFELLNIQRYKQ